MIIVKEHLTEIHENGLYSSASRWPNSLTGSVVSFISCKKLWILIRKNLGSIMLEV